MCSSLSLTDEARESQKPSEFTNPDRQIQEIFFENRLGSTTTPSISGKC